MRQAKELRTVLQAAARGRATQASRIFLDAASLGPFLDSIAPHANAMTPASQWDLCEASQQRAHLLPSVLQDAVHGIYRAGHDPRVHVSGVPVPYGKLNVHSPLLNEVERESAAALFVTLAVHAAIGSLAGRQYTFMEERGENTFHLVMPAPNAPVGTQSSVGSSAVNFHTEDPVLPIEIFQPRALCLSMVRSQPDVRTVITPVDALSQDLLASANLLETLCANRFRHPAPDVVRIMGGEQARSAEDAYESSEGRPIIYLQPRGDELADGPIACMTLTEETDAIDPEDSEAREAVKVLRSLLLARTTSYDMQPGETVIWANQRAAHARTGTLSPRYDGYDRLLVRTFHHPSPPTMVV